MSTLERRFNTFLAVTFVLFFGFASALNFPPSHGGHHHELSPEVLKSTMIIRTVAAILKIMATPGTPLVVPVAQTVQTAMVEMVEMPLRARRFHNIHLKVQGCRIEELLLILL